jgi:hypothetical protein
MSKSKLVSKASDIVSYRPKPSISITADDLPAIKDWKVGKSYELKVTAKMVYMSEGDRYGDEYEGESSLKSPLEAKLRITKVTESSK